MYAVGLDMPRQLEGNAHNGDSEPEALQVLGTLRSDAKPSTRAAAGTRAFLCHIAQEKRSSDMETGYRPTRPSHLHAMSATATTPRGRGRPRLPTPERRERVLASKRAWRDRNLERLHESDRLRRATEAYKARDRAARRARYIPSRRPRLSDEERRERHREAVRRYHARARERRNAAREARVQSPGPVE
jgi:hypothetical protein